MFYGLPLFRFRSTGFFACVAFCSVFIYKVSADDGINWAVTTLAGHSAVEGADDGMAGNAHFNAPRGLVVDTSGQIFVSDTLNHTIRKVSPSGAVTTFAGLPGTSGATDGAGTVALFNSPSGIAIDNAGALYVADTLNHTIRKITPDGTVSTLAGSAGNPGCEDGGATTARFREPVGVAVDSNGNVYVVDRGNFTIRKITDSGVVTTLAGIAGESGGEDGTKIAAHFDEPCGIALDELGNVYIADTFNHTIRKLTPAGDVSTLAGAAGQSGTADGSSIAARFSGPSSLAIDSAGNVYVAETANHEIRVISSSGMISTLAGSPGDEGSSDGVGTSSRFNAPGGITVGPAGNLFVCDTVNNTIRKLTPVRAANISSELPNVKLINISTRSYVGAGSKAMVAGFIIGGLAPKQLLIRASGPGIAQFGVSALEDPVLTLYSGGTQIAQNDDWSVEADRIGVVTKRASAFPWDRESKDAALLVILPPGGYTAHVSGKDGASGTALVEVYEADDCPSTGHLLSMFTRAEVRTGSDIMIAGFVIGGSSSKKVLIRASGPALSDFGLTGVLADPVLSVNSIQGEIAQNDNWGTDDQNAIDAAVSQTGAFAWKRGSKDAALVLTLSPGNYTALVRGKDEATGIALIEVCEAP